MGKRILSPFNKGNPLELGETATRPYLTPKLLAARSHSEDHFRKDSMDVIHFIWTSDLVKTNLWIRSQDHGSLQRHGLWGPIGVPWCGSWSQHCVCSIRIYGACDICTFLCVTPVRCSHLTERGQHETVVSLEKDLGTTEFSSSTAAHFKGVEKGC